MQADKQTSYSNTYSYNHSSKMKCKRVWKKNVRLCVIEEETEELGEKPLSRPQSGN